MRVRCHQCRSQYPLDVGRCPNCGMDFRQAWPLLSFRRPVLKSSLMRDGQRSPPAAGDVTKRT
jgi:predicted amidophosphoribosyltransferase